MLKLNFKILKILTKKLQGLIYLQSQCTQSRSLLYWRKPPILLQNPRQAQAGDLSAEHQHPWNRVLLRQQSGAPRLCVQKQVAGRGCAHLQQED